MYLQATRLHVQRDVLLTRQKGGSWRSQSWLLFEPEVDASIDKADGFSSSKSAMRTSRQRRNPDDDIPMISDPLRADLYAAKKNIEIIPRADKFLWAYEIDVKE